MSPREWTSVNDVLPEVDSHVLVIDENNNIFTAYYVWYSDREKNIFRLLDQTQNAVYESGHITHWLYIKNLARPNRTMNP